jgi:hypothetical protein
VPTERNVLVVVHNVTAATRLFDVLPLIATDPRVRIVFTCPESSAFTAGTSEFLAARGVAVLPWRDAIRRRFDAAISASYGGALHKLRAPLIAIPHGMGYNKYLSSKAAKQQSSKAAKQQSSKAAKQQSSKAAKQQSSKAAKQQSSFRAF